MWKTNSLQRLPGSIRWALTFIWTAITLALMLSPSGDGTTVTAASDLFGGTDIVDAMGHIVINAILIFLWCWTINPPIRLILIGGIIWCFVAEFLQIFVPDRGASLLDLAANIVGVLIGIAVYRWIISF